VSEHDLRDDYDDEPWRKRWRPEDQLFLPATAILAFGIFQFGWTIVSLAIPEMFLPAEGEPVLVFALSVLVVAWHGVIVYGASGMRRFRRYPTAVIATVMSLMPCPFVPFALFSIPLGVWTMIVLCRRDVRARFEAVARTAPDNSISTNPPTGT
jgi:hypothetical protein